MLFLCCASCWSPTRGTSETQQVTDSIRFWRPLLFCFFFYHIAHRRRVLPTYLSTPPPPPAKPDSQAAPNDSQLFLYGNSNELTILISVKKISAPISTTIYNLERKIQPPRCIILHLQESFHSKTLHYIVLIYQHYRNNFL